MQIFAYLEDDYPVDPNTDGSDAVFAFGEKVYNAAYNPYVYVSGAAEYMDLLPEFEDYVHYWSLHDTIKSDAPERYRRIGEYRHFDAQARVLAHNNEGRQPVKVHGPTCEHVVALWRLILAGEIAPEISYEDGQVESNALGVKGAFSALLNAISVWWASYRFFGR